MFENSELLQKADEIYKEFSEYVKTNLESLPKQEGSVEELHRDLFESWLILKFAMYETKFKEIIEVFQKFSKSE